MADEYDVLVLRALPQLALREERLVRLPLAELEQLRHRDCVEGVTLKRARAREDGAAEVLAAH